ncbi:aldolase [Pseudovirgaria hyperparasitica]|uniref:Aldolase n=1 Tax=Pseudovirgaria hyperparasitica TaxID=470096 RepID=A0A6A6WA93_9PEZI|nr:aldolase [Pseudovirgaria hyperparasitica]KAF2759778.1 aldolase [Pseudovirgaria hyperparasitica]
MATKLLVETVSPTPFSKSMAVVDVQEIPTLQKPSLLVVFGKESEALVGVIADVLGQKAEISGSVSEVKAGLKDTIHGISRKSFLAEAAEWDSSRLLLNTHCVDGEGETLDEAFSSQCDYEYLYTKTTFYRRDLARFLSFILGQINPHDSLAKKLRTTLLSTTFPDIHAALPNLDILSVGADAVELRVDLLKEPLPDGSYSPIPSLKYVGEQLMTLRQRTELPIIYTTRCTNENGRFPMDDPVLFYTYLRKAIQWGCEYIDVELWLPEDIRRKLSETKGSSRIISAFHDFSGKFKWTTTEAEDLFRKGAVYGDVVKMIALVTSTQENYELEYFRSLIESKYSHPPLSGLNMGPQGQLSRALNKVFTPITHPLLPMIAAPGQLSAAEINVARFNMGQFAKKDIYGIGSYRSMTQAMFFEKCFNELSLPHQFIFLEKSPKGPIDAILKRPNFGGAYINPPVAISSPSLPTMSDAAFAIGQVDTVLVHQNGEISHEGDNARWKGIRSTLTRDFVPTAYSQRAALILASAESDAAPAIFALKSLGIGPIFTIGFKMHGTLKGDVEQVRSVEDMKRLDQPFVIISALPAEKSMSVAPLLKHYSGDGTGLGKSAGKVFVDLSTGPRKNDPLTVAASTGWTVYSIADVSAWTTVETLRLLVGQNVPYDFVRLASGQGLF